LFGFGIIFGPILPPEFYGIDRQAADPAADDDENAPGALFNECTETIHDEGEDEDVEATD
jgi:hypothetical protein